MEGVLRALVLVVSCGGLVQVLGFTLSPCGSDDTAEVIKGKSDNAFTCTSQDGQEVTWTVVDDPNSVLVGTCSAGSTSGSCTGGSLGAAFTASRLSGTQTKMIVNPTALNNKKYVESWYLTCGDKSNADRCQMDYIVPTQGSCSIQTGTGPSRFKLDGNCSLHSAESSRGRFSCLWIRSGGGTSWQRKVDLSQSSYQSGCVLREALPTETGDYSYTVQLTPGRTNVSAGTVRIVKPGTPTVSGCGGEGYIRENTNVTCTCNTNNIGAPAGRLQWVKTGGSSGNGVLKEGNYDASSLTVSQKLVRSDHQSTQFRCHVPWTTDVTGDAVKFNVGYPPTKAYLGINDLQGDQTVDEHRSVNFSCRHSNGRPIPTLSLQKTDNNTELASRTNYLNYVVVSRCEDSGQYQCTADNGMGPKVTATPRSLYVRCSPRGQEDLGEVNFNNKSVSTTFDVTAYPVPHKVTFKYLGPLGNETQSSDVDVGKIQLTGECKAKAGVIYQSSCMVTVNNVTDETAAGFYTVTVTNVRGSGDFRLQVLFRAPVTAAPRTGGDDPSPIGIIVGVVVAVLVISAVIVIVVIVVMKRRKDPAKEKLQTSGGAGSGANGRHSGYHGQADNPGLEVDPEDLATSPSSPTGGLHMSSDTSAAGENAYAVVNKQPLKKKEEEKEEGGPKVAAVAAAAAAAGGDVYAVVDVTKKKKKEEAGGGAQGKKKGKAAAPPDKPKKGKGKKKAGAGKEEAEGHIYGNVESGQKEDRRKKGQEPCAMPMQETTGDTGKHVNAEGLVYTSVDFTGITLPDKPPREAATATTDQSVLYSAVDFVKTGHV